MTRRSVLKVMAGFLGLSALVPSKLLAAPSLDQSNTLTISEYGMQPEAVLVSTPKGENYWWKQYAQSIAIEPDYIVTSQENWNSFWKLLADVEETRHKKQIERLNRKLYP